MWLKNLLLEESIGEGRVRRLVERYQHPAAPESQLRRMLYRFPDLAVIFVNTDV